METTKAKTKAANTYQERRKVLVKVLRATGSMAQACRVAGLDRSNIHKRIKADPVFRRRVERAKSAALARLEAKATEVAERGWTETTTETDADGRVKVTTRERYSPQATVRVLGALAPEKWGNRVTNVHRGQVSITTPAIQSRLLADPTALAAACELAARLAAPEAASEPPGRWVDGSPSPGQQALPGPSTAPGRAATPDTAD